MLCCTHGKRGPGAAEQEAPRRGRSVIMKYRGNILGYIVIMRKKSAQESLGQKFKMAYSTQEEISENVKQARDNALVGNYDESNVFYKGALQGVQQMFKTTPDPDMKQKWKQVVTSYYKGCLYSHLVL